MGGSFLFFLSIVLGRRMGARVSLVYCVFSSFSDHVLLSYTQIMLYFSYVIHSDHMYMYVHLRATCTSTRIMYVPIFLQKQ